MGNNSSYNHPQCTGRRSYHLQNINASVQSFTSNLGAIRSSNSKIPSSWKHLVEWCIEANELLMTLQRIYDYNYDDDDDDNDNKQQGGGGRRRRHYRRSSSSSDDDDDDDCRRINLFHVSFTPMVHRDVLTSPSRYVEARKKKCVILTCSGSGHDDGDDNDDDEKGVVSWLDQQKQQTQRPQGQCHFCKNRQTTNMTTTPVCMVDSLASLELVPLTRWSLATIYNGMIVIVVTDVSKSTTMTANDDDDDDDKINKNSNDDDTHSTMKTQSSSSPSSIRCHRRRLCLTIPTFTTLLSLLRAWVTTLTTGPHHPQATTKAVAGLPPRPLSNRQQQQRIIPNDEDDDDDDECIICMDGRIQVVLPCSHGYCAKCCSHGWMKENEQCPLCRGEFEDYEEEQWQLETWSEMDTTKQIDDIECQVQLLWERAMERGKVIDVVDGERYVELVLTMK